MIQPELVIKSVVPVIMVGDLDIGGWIIAVIFSTGFVKTLSESGHEHVYNDNKKTYPAHKISRRTRGEGCLLSANARGISKVIRFQVFAVDEMPKVFAFRNSLLRYWE